MERCGVDAPRPFEIENREIGDGAGLQRAAGQERLPGDRRYANRRLAMAEGIPVETAELARLRDLAAG